MADQDVVTRLNAALEGRYRVERQLGEGGMAAVYLAEDLRHERKLALKVLKPELAAVVGAERFLAEIKTTAKLQHPHILPLHDSGTADGFLFYVMPYVEGESLRERLDREHQLPVDEAVRIAQDVADALQAAHDQGVIHRDVKPANILLSKGRPLVSDFGIALALGAAGAGRLTETGLSLGTPHYMSPEQATGDLSVGAATDIYALGCVLYETLVGSPPFVGSTPQAVLGKIVTGDAPSVADERKSVPPNVDMAIRKALEKVPADRFTTVEAFAAALADASFGYGLETTQRGSADGGGGYRRTAVVALAAFALGVVATAIWGNIGDGPVSSGPAWFPMPAPGLVSRSAAPLFRDLTISRDGEIIAYVSADTTGDEATLQISLRPIGQLVGGPVTGPENVAEAFFSPDGAHIGFLEGRQIGAQRLRRVAVSGGPLVNVAESSLQIWGAAWGREDRIVFGTLGGGLFVVDARGGTPRPLTTLAPGESGHTWPSFIEGTDAVLFVAAGEFSDVGPSSRLAVVDMATETIQRLDVQGTSPRYVRTGHIVYANRNDGSLRAVPFDVQGFRITGSSVPLVENVQSGPTGATDFDVSNDGTLIFRGGSVTGPRIYQLVWVDRRGQEEPLPMPPRAYEHPRLSPDGGRVAVSVIEGLGQMELWVYETRSGAGLPLTNNGERNMVPIWTPDGQRILFASTKDAPRPDSYPGIWYGYLYSVPADGRSGATRVGFDVPSGITPDGNTVLGVQVRQLGNVRATQLMATPADGSAEPTVLRSLEFELFSPSVSPDGRWLAYRSNEGGSFEIYVEPFPGPGGRVPVSVGGGLDPIWSADGSELFYVGPDRQMMAAIIEGQSAPRVVARTALFSTEPYALGAPAPRRHHVAPDGRFLMMKPTGDESSADAPSTPTITVVLNWFEELRERMGR